jgi:transmembrane sensor
MQLFPESEPEILFYLSGEHLSPEIRKDIEHWASQSPKRQQLLDDFKNGAAWIPARLRELEQLDTSGIWQKLTTSLESAGVGPFPEYPETFTSRRAVRTHPRAAFKRYIAAASLVILIATLIAISFSGPSIKTAAKGADTPLSAEIIPPGGNKATLTLADGRNIVLDSASMGLLANQGGTKIEKTDSGSLRYLKTAAPAQVAAYNTLRTPRAGQFSVILPDGTHVWLNNVSSLHYPTTFTGSTREVDLTGEAYFEVAEDKAHPFSVHILRRPGDKEYAGTVEDIGTAFNIKAYEDEDTLYTTLVTGQASFQVKGKRSPLSPGSQLLLSSDSTIIHRGVDIERMIAWKNGNFNFYHSNLRSTMRQLARWYDVDVKYQAIPPVDYEFMGGISRNSTLEEILKALEPYGIHSRVEGRTIIVQ